MRYLLMGVFAVTLSAAPQMLWRDPGRVERLDMVGGPGGRSAAPLPPFRFIREETSGTSPKVRVQDKRGAQWIVKWGQEVKAETFASRIAWAAGYLVEPVYYVRTGKIAGARELGRARRYVDKYGAFRDARFELVMPSRRYARTAGWNWDKNPFSGTRQLNGLKIVLMLTSNWDNKDARDSTTNTAVVQEGSGRDRRWLYMVTDWGGSMGKWGNFFTREKWDCEGYAKQTEHFVESVDRGVVEFGFSGKHDGEFKENIRAEDVRWTMRYLGRLSDLQIRSALKASGASLHEQKCFSRAFRTRLRQLQHAASL